MPRPRKAAALVVAATPYDVDYRQQAAVSGVPAMLISSNVHQSSGWPASGRQCTTVAELLCVF